MTDQDLRAKIAALKVDNESLTDALNMERQVIQKLRERLNADQNATDAARYRFLRNQTDQARFGLPAIALAFSLDGKRASWIAGEKADKLLAECNIMRKTLEDIAANKRKTREQRLANSCIAFLDALK